MKNTEQITQEQLDDLAKQNRESIARRDTKDIAEYLKVIKGKLIKSRWTDGWTDETIINTALAFVVDHMDEFNDQFKP
tara:strand:- start:389 stop:622 length:234 start_codon:yes stop_codon:yes gene_type:complete